MHIGLFLAYWPRCSPDEQVALAMPFGDRPAIGGRLPGRCRLIVRVP